MPRSEPLCPHATNPDLDAATEQLLARHRDLVGLRVLLDDDELTDWLSRGPAGPPARVSRQRLRLKPGSSAVLAARVRWPDDPSPQDVLVSAFTRGAQPKLRKTLRRARVDEVVASEPGRGLTATLARADRDLRVMDTLRDPEHLSRLVGSRPMSTRTLSYNPHRRWVGFVETEQERLVLRCYRKPAASAVWRTLGDLGRLGAPVPRRVARRTGLGTIVLGHVPGGSLETVAELDDLEAAGACLASLHLTPAELPDRSLPPDAGLAQGAEAIAALLPAEAARARRVAAVVSARLHEEPPGPAVPVHGDCSLDQIVRGDQRTRLIDLDRAHQGDAADDLGGLVAHLRHRRSEAELDVRAVLEGYASSAPLPDPDRIALWAAHHCLIHAVDPFRRCEEDWSTGLSAWLDVAEALLRGESW